MSYTLETATDTDSLISDESRIAPHFRTDHLLADLKGRAVRGGAITLAAQGIKFALQMGSTMVLARLLTPADFGLIAMVLVVTGFAAMFKDAGLSMATIQREHITHEQVSTLFWINVALSVLFMLAVAALAPAIAWFYGKPELTWITIALSATFVLGGLTVQHYALLVRQMRFVSTASIQVGSMIGGAIVGIGMALAGFGYWSLVGMLAAQGFVAAILSWIMTGWIPGKPSRAQELRQLLSFGGNLTGYEGISFVMQNVPNVLIGFLMGSQVLGIYAKASGTVLLPIRQLVAPLNAVVAPTLSRLHGKDDQLRSAVLKIIALFSLVASSLACVTAIDADILVSIVLGPQWERSIVLVRNLAPALYFTTMSSIATWIYIARGEVRRQLWCAVLLSPVGIAGIVFAVQYGAEVVAGAVSAFAALTAIITLRDTTSRIGLSSLKILVVVGIPVAISIIAAGTAFALSEAIGVTTIWSRAICHAGIGSITLALLCIMIPSMRNNIVWLVKLMVKNKNNCSM